MKWLANQRSPRALQTKLEFQAGHGTQIRLIQTAGRPTA